MEHSLKQLPSHSMGVDSQLHSTTVATANNQYLDSNSNLTYHLVAIINNDF